MNPASRKRKAFTLVEMLVVVAVIAILVTIVVSVTGMVIRRQDEQQTRTNMQAIMVAIQTYYDLQGDFPADPTPQDFDGKPATWKTRDWQAFVRGKKLYDQLVAVPQVQARLAPLYKDGIINVRGNQVFADGFSKYIEYYRTGGAGGRPLLVSAGADADFDRTEDNIRSDNR